MMSFPLRSWMLLWMLVLSPPLNAVAVQPQGVGPSAPIAHSNTSDSANVAVLDTVGALGDGRVAVSIELQGEPAIETYLTAKSNYKRLGDTQAEAKAVKAGKGAIAKLKAQQASFVLLIKRVGMPHEELYRLQRVGNAVAVLVDANELSYLRSLPMVKRVAALPSWQMTNASAVGWVNTPAYWQATGLTGAGVKIAVVDGGIDYFHTDFGGPGTGYATNNSASTTDTVGIYPGVKIAGGYDVAGDDYNGNNVPHPDPDPIDCHGHGTAVTGTLAGYGVTATGARYTGPYSAGVSLSGMRIAPGVAPLATIYAYKAFGCPNSSRIIAAAIERAVDPNQDGDFSDAPQILNLSVGTRFGSADISDSSAAKLAWKLGICVVSAMGNDGNSFYVASAPGTTKEILSAGAINDSPIVFDRLVVGGTSPANYIGKFAETAPKPGFGGLTGEAVLVQPQDACSAVTNGAALEGKIAVIDRKNCLISEKLTAFNGINIKALVICNSTENAPLVPSDRVTSDGTPLWPYPIMMISKDDGSALTALIASNPGLQVTLDADHPSTHTEYGDTIADFSSRGPTAETSRIKPDVATPGADVFTALYGSGSQGLTVSGTSLASPILAGIAALLKQLHPTWQNHEIKALIINTAAHDIIISPTNPQRIGSTLSGAGRADLELARQAQAIAYIPEEPDTVSLSFGPLEVADTLTTERLVRVANKGATDLTWNLSYDAINSIPGVSVSFPDGGQVNVPVGQTRNFRVQLTASALSMNYQIPVGMATTQMGVGRFYQPEHFGLIKLSPVGNGPALRLPVYATARRVCQMRAIATQLNLTAATGTQNMVLAGNGFAQGPPPYFNCWVWPFECFYYNSANPDGTPAEQMKKLKAFGIRRHADSTSDYTQLYLLFGIATEGNWASPNHVQYQIMIDLNNDYVVDAAVLNSYYTNTTYDVLTSQYQIPAGTGVGSPFFMNDFNPLSTITFAYNTNVMILRVSAAQIGLTPLNSKFNFYVRSIDVHSLAEGMRTGWMGYDAAAPGLEFGSNTAFYDTNNNYIPVTANRESFTRHRAKGLLLLHGMNANGQRVQFIPANMGAVDWQAYH